MTLFLLCEFVTDPIFAAICKIKVDFPIPGSPPSKINEPGTMPPPSTWSTSIMPVERRGTSACDMCEKCIAVAGAAEGDDFFFSSATPCDSVPHAPHSRHRPAHLGVCVSQFEQVKMVVDDIWIEYTRVVYGGTVIFTIMVAVH